MPTPSGFPTSQDLINAQKDVEHLGRVVNSEDAQGSPIASSTNRTGGTNKTLDALQVDYQEAIQAAGGVPLGTWSAGVTINAYNEYLVYNGIPYKPASSTPLPYTTQGGDPTVAPDAGNVVPFAEVQASDLVTVREDLLGPGTKLYMGDDGESVKVGDMVPAGTTHLRVEIGVGDYKLVRLVSLVGGLVSAVSEFEASIGGVTVGLSSTNRRVYVDLISDISNTSAFAGQRVVCSGFYESGDFIRHPGFIVRTGPATEITGRVYNLANGNHVEIDCDENSINANWIGVNTSRSEVENATALQNYLSGIPAGVWHTVFFHENVALGECIITRDNTEIITNRKAQISTSEWAIRPDCNNFKMVGFRTPNNFNGRLSYVDSNANQVENHEYIDIKINGADPVNRTVFLYSTAQGGAGWKNVEYYRVRGLTQKTANAPLINHDHGTTVNECLDTYITKCRAHGYQEIYKSTGSGFSRGLIVKDSFAIDCNGKGINTYHTRGGIVINSLSVEGHAESAYVWAGVLITDTSRYGAQITNCKFNRCTDSTPNPNDGVNPIGHGVIYEQLQKAYLSGNQYQKNKGAGYVYGAGCYVDNAHGETSVQNRWGCIVAGDAGGFTDVIRHVSITNANHWGNLLDSVLICGTVEVLKIQGGSHKQNCTANGSLSGGYASVRFDKDHSEAKSGGTPDPTPKLGMLKVIGSELGIHRDGGNTIDSYPQFSISIIQDSIVTVSVMSSHLGAFYNATKNTGEIEVSTPSGSTVTVLGCLKESPSSQDLLAATSSGVSTFTVDATYNEDGTVV